MTYLPRRQKLKTLRKRRWKKKHKKMKAEKRKLKKKRKKEAEQQEGEEEVLEEGRKFISGVSDAPEDDPFADLRGKKEMKTEEGYRIFTEKQLKLGQGGGTKLCPFDCDCCY
eukprot:TRINITY_DN16784_c0_g1_i1.p1 TRINITY_DN16784_c0_g1~~TRINITY_DN16784_c0_g1_i1.p1  ORF type:complete len:112 (-),score=38.68 TRINITY_DN16784_c0_g1_i1:27-362(-)